MSELNKEKLLDWINRAASLWPDTPTAEERQAYQQIRQLIENQPICIFCALPITGQEGACEKCANRALEDLSHWPKVDEEFIKHLAGEIFYTDWSLSGYEDRIREMFKEAGVKIKEK